MASIHNGIFFIHERRNLAICDNMNGSTKIVASGPNTSWQIDGQTVDTASDFIVLGSRTTADGDCRHEIETLAPWKESYDQPRQHIKKQRHYFASKGPPSPLVFPVVRYGSESWTIKKAEHRRIDAFELWCWRRLLRVPWTAGRSNKSIVKEISPEYSLEGLTPTTILWPPDVKS